MVATFALTVLILKWLIPKLRSLKMGQTILDIGPRWHKSKEGTPTMGGLSFLVAMSVVILTVGVAAVITDNHAWAAKFFITYGMALCYALIGIWDDSLKITKKENEGFTAGQKYLLQLFIAIAYLVAMKIWGGLTTELYFPYFDKAVELGPVYYVIATLLITGVVNAANLTDGIDGLAASVTTVIGGFFAVAAFLSEQLPAALISAMVIGGCVGFLVYNFYPARVFMGDTGSLFLGGLAVGLAFLINNPLIVLLVGLIYVIEAASVIIQVGVYKLTKKRVFKMAPIHHHFEKCGWSEIKVVAVFSLVTLIISVIAYFGLAK
ncbi:MAG: phospho-N-acetylmuramoyl-pentapeptide-transferase [Clostridia bacterium]|nr:phospho-N-acetylmuramoyl-pentapeptide-transferase [Clostridia bacterium]MBQ4601719.1 phospho-N-acetylmuramoyl-pentapeptide-transferase [Clostridia bacterium]